MNHREYRPRRAAAKVWLINAPGYVLEVQDVGPSEEYRYIVYLTGRFWHPEMGRNVIYLALRPDPSGADGLRVGECPASVRVLGKRIRWMDLPLYVRDMIVLRVRITDKLVKRLNEGEK